uniref:Calpain n=1 Tax=Anopheles stephensi TaxID=30069 RepID=A0A182YCB5_ANOST
MDFISWQFGFECEDQEDQSSSSNEIEEDQPKEQESFQSIRARCLAEGTLYEDPDFPANDFSIYHSKPLSNDEPPIRWKRPGEIVSEPKFVTDGYSRFDVRQGQLGNCWFIASCATLTSHPKLFERVVPQDNGQFDEGNYAGAFHFHFWQYGQWVEVIVDDRLPVSSGGNVLLYMSSSVREEFWAALLEKAYAKLHGSYNALTGGSGVEGMVDLTGGIAEFYRLDGTEPDDLFDRVERNLARKSLLTAGINGDREGRLQSVNLLSTHEYSVTKVTRLNASQHMLPSGLAEDVRLICVRNPWGQTEWSGPWGDHSIEWILVTDEKMAALNIEREDGEFWMKFEDFVQYFDDLSVCYQCPGDMSEELKRCYPWEMMIQQGEWKRGITAGGSGRKSFWRNPQCFLQLGEDCCLPTSRTKRPEVSLTLGLMQMHHRERGIEHLSLRLCVYAIPDHVLIGHRTLPGAFFDNVTPLEADDEFQTGREFVARYKLPPGRYVIVPFTWKPNQASEFLLRIFAEGHLDKICYCGGAFAQSPPASQWPTVPSPSSSGYSSHNPSISGQSLSYGFNPNVMPALPDSGSGYPPSNTQLPYPTMGFVAFGSPMDYSMPDLPPPVPDALLRGPEPVASCEEIPFQAISIPIAEGMFSPGLLSGAGKQLFDAAGQAITSAATEYIGSVINEMFVKKESDTKRFLPSIKNMKVVSVGCDDRPSVHLPPAQGYDLTIIRLCVHLGDRNRGQRSSADVQDFYQIRQQCLENGTLFEDPEFPATASSLMYSQRPDRHYEWLRPHEICDGPEFFVEGFSRFDVQQGELGDCWLLAACANLTQDHKMFLRVVPDDNSFEDDYAGVFHFRFWQYGKWVDVVIDDRLPTYRGQLIYMRSSEQNEFWSALLEKAYAKLHGSYESLRGGTTCEAMEDFTGGVAEMYDLKDQTPPNLYEIIEKGFKRNSMFGCSIEADPHVLEAETPEGLIRGHAYSITKIQLVDIETPGRSGKIPLIRLRNPWGNEAEWNGPWSDKSAEWRYIPDEQKQELGLNFDHDGEFWMSYRDFTRYFDRMEICNLSPDSLSDDQFTRGKIRWEMSMFEGEWAPGSTAGGCRNYLDTFWHNPQYVIRLEDPDEDDAEGNCTVIIALLQKNRRARRNMGVECLTIGFAVYRVTERDLAQKPLKMNFFKYNASAARSPAFINLREVSCRFKLPPGTYVIVPSTFEPNEEGEFIIRVFSETANSMEENDDNVGVGDLDDRIAPDVPGYVQPSPQRQAMERLFLDVAGADGEVDWVELKRILDHSFRDDLPKTNSLNGINRQAYASQQNAEVGAGPGGAGDNISAEGFSKDVCRAMVAMLDVDHTGKLGFEEFQQLLTDIAKWKAVFKLYDTEGSGRLSPFQLREALTSAGYHLNNRILNALVHRYGSRSGTIPFDDFIMCAVKIKTMIEIFRERDTDGTNQATFSMDEWVEKTLYS